LLLLPAKLIGKTIEEFRGYSRHFRIPRVQIYSYERIGLEAHAELISSYRPDLIMADEAHKLKHVRKAACARRVARYLGDHPNTQFLCCSGTLTKGSILDYAHLLIWALRSGAPIPLDEYGIKEWAEALDARSAQNANLNPLVPALGEIYDISHARQRYAERLCSTRGVIVSRDSFRGVPLTISVTTLPVPTEVEEHLHTLRTLWRAPDGWDFGDAKFQVWGAARQYGRGFALVHDPRPPLDWYQARRKWTGFVRRILEQSDAYDSELQVFNACANGQLPQDVWAPWVEIKPTFKPVSKPIWFSDAVIDWVSDWGRRNPEGSLIWVEHVAFAERLAEKTGWKYYREEGLAPDGEYIEHADPTKPAIVSVKSNLEGRNLQFKFHKNLIVAPRPEGPVNEQLIGRTHRDGQVKPVSVEYIEIVDEDTTSIEGAFREAKYAYESTTQEQKLLIGELVA
jgi:hypothetical protein